MTNGIIQEVFRKYKNYRIDNLSRLEKELIEKIKKEFYDVVEMNEEYILKTLIGDNNE